MKKVWYNENDPKAAAWLRELIVCGHLPDGDVDERSIEDVRPSEVVGYTQCHFFAGIGGWPLALRQAGWPDDRPVWTGSCPCQSFSPAGKRGGFTDKRHLWPSWHWLIEQCGPDEIFGEQVANGDGLAWLDLVQADMEGTGYASQAVDICVAGVGAPHIRQRLWIHAERLEHTQINGRLERRAEPSGRGATGGRSLVGLADDDSGLEGRGQPGRERAAEFSAGPGSVVGGLADADRPGPTNGLWRDADWLHCRDGKWRPVEPGTLPLAHGIPGRVGLLRGYGNAVNVKLAKIFIEAATERNHCG